MAVYVPLILFIPNEGQRGEKHKKKNLNSNVSQML